MQARLGARPAADPVSLLPPLPSTTKLATPTPDTLRHGGAVRGLAFDAAGARLAAGGDDKCVRVYSTADWSLLATWCVGVGVGAPRMRGERRGACGRGKQGNMHKCVAHVFDP